MLLAVRLTEVTCESRSVTDGLLVPMEEEEEAGLRSYLQGSGGGTSLASTPRVSSLMWGGTASFLLPHHLHPACVRVVFSTITRLCSLVRRLEGQR